MISVTFVHTHMEHRQTFGHSVNERHEHAFTGRTHSTLGLNTCVDLCMDHPKTL